MPSSICRCSTFPICRACRRRTRICKPSGSTPPTRAGRCCLTWRRRSLKCFSTERQAEAAANRRQVAQQFVDETRLQVEAGLANRNDLTRLELELASAQLVNTQTQNSLVKARLQLGFLMGRDVDEPLEEPVTPAADFAASPDAEREQRRPDFRSAVLRSEAARARGRAPWLDMLPSLGLRLTYYPPEIIDNGSSGSDWIVGGTLSWNLFNPRLFAQSGVQSAEFRIAREQTRALGRQLVLDSRNADANLASARAAVTQADVRLRVAQQNAEEVRERFRLGLATAIEQADANVSEFEARADVARQRFALQQALLDRVRADGYGPEAVFPVTE